MSGQPVEGIWIDRTEQHRARQRGEPAADERFTTTLRLELSPLPCWDGLSPHERHAKIRAMVREIEREMEGVAVLGRKAICAQHPHDQPQSKAQKTPAPRFYATKPEVRRALEWGYLGFWITYRAAAEAWRAGKKALFPPNCFLPGRFEPLRI